MTEKTCSQDTPVVHYEKRDGATVAVAKYGGHTYAARVGACAAAAAEDAADMAVAIARLNEPDIPYAEVIADLQNRGQI